MRGLLGMLPGQVVLSAFEVQGSQGAVGAGVRGVEAHRLLQRGEHGLILAVLRIGHGEEVVRIGHLGNKFHQGAELSYSGSGFALLQVPDTQIEVCFGMAWLEPQGLLQLLLHGDEIATGPVGQGEVVVGRHRPGVATHRRLELGNRPRQFAAFGVQRAEIVVRRQEVRIAPQRFLQLRDRRLGLPLGGQHRAQVVVALRLLWLELEHGAIRRRSLVQAAAADVELAEMGIGLGKIRCQTQHGLKLRFCPGCLALLSIRQAHALHGVHQARMALQGLLKVTDGLCVTTGAQGIFAETIRRFGQVLVELRCSAVHLISQVVQLGRLRGERRIA